MLKKYVEDHYDEEDVVWAAGDLMNELSDISWKMQEIDKQIRSAMDTLTDIVRNQMRGSLRSFDISEVLINDLHKTIDNLDSFRQALDDEYHELSTIAESVDPLFWCTR